MTRELLDGRRHVPPAGEQQARVDRLDDEGRPAAPVYQFNAGYIIACANLVNLHDQPGMAADVMSEAGISWTEVKRLGLSDYDMKALRQIKAERGGKAFADGRKRPRR